MPRIPFATEAGQQVAASWSSMRIVNFMPRPAPPGSRVDLALVPTPGLTTWAGGAVGAGPIHVLAPRRDNVIAMSGDGTLYELNLVANTVTSRGTFSGSGFDYAGAPADSTTTQTVIVIPPSMWYITDGGVSGNVTALPNGARFGTVAVVDGFAIYTEAPTTGSSSQFWVSNLLAAQTIGALNFASAESSVDGLVRAFNMKGDLWLFGTRSTEVWGNAGTTGVPFQRRPGGTIGVGCAAALSPAMVGDGVCWLGNDRCVYRSTGGQPQKISTFAIDGELRQLATASNARGMSISHDGHSQYVLSFPSAFKTFAWDATTGLWHEKSTQGIHWRGNCAIHQNGRQYVGHNSSGTMMLVDAAATTDAGSSILRSATLPPLWASTRRAFMSRLELEVGRVNTAGTSIPVNMSYSDDGGTTFINSRGLIYDASTDPRLVWHRLGSFRQRTIRFDFPNEWPHLLYAADAQIEGGAS